jgi:hypothetical protein
MNEKLDSLVCTETFTTVGRFTSMKTIPCKCVFTIKRDSLGNVSRYKARLVAKGFRQQHGTDYDQTFAPTLNISSVRLLLTLAVHLDYETAHLDVKTAFLNGVCGEEIYMQPPEGTKSLETGKSWKLNRCLYGLKQAPREWNCCISQCLCNLGCKQNAGVYSKSADTEHSIIGLFVDDLRAISRHNSDLDTFVRQ